MKYYANIKDLEPHIISELLQMCFNYCNNINIYFPHDCSSDIKSFKDAFVSLTSIGEIDQEDTDLGQLDEKEGFSMLIATLSRDIETLLLNKPPNINISYGLLDETHLFLYLDEEGEIIIESDKLLPNIHPVLMHLKEV
ncbi:MAG: hypothetical protein ATN35_02315 [Epulopiscium sp. Nele67-Bin004]|nr:MAG: hypothetical protein ATN35_02315 [Epulopiscium sp. Nele67-Bin004]